MYGLHTERRGSEAQNKCTTLQTGLQCRPDRVIGIRSLSERLCACCLPPNELLPGPVGVGDSVARLPTVIGSDLSILLVLWWS